MVTMLPQAQLIVHTRTHTHTHAQNTHQLEL